MNKKNFTLIEPNIWKHNTEQKYVVDIFLGRDAEGKQQRTSRTCYTLADARKTLTLAKADKIKGTAKTKCKAPSIFELMDDYRQTYVEVNTEQTTSYGYSVIENHIKAFFESTGKNTRVDKITATTIDQYYKYLRDIRSTRLPNGIGARHLNASILLKVLPVANVSEHLGHSSTDTTTRVYAHSMPKHKSEVARELDTMFEAS